MFADPFELIDRFKPNDDNDEREVIKIANAIDQAQGRAPRPRDIGNINLSDVTDSIKQFQARNGLKVDGIVRPKGPTVQTAAAATFARKPKPAYQQIIGRGANVPLYGSVGPGQTNLPADIRTLNAGLVLTNPHRHRRKGPIPMPTPELGEPGAPKSKPIPLPTPPLSTGKSTAIPLPSPFDDPEPTDIENSIKDVQRQHGLKVDGIVEPFGPTHDLLDNLLAPRLDRLVGQDIDNPLPFLRREPEMVARTLAFRPSTIRTFWQEPDSMDTEEEHSAALTLRDATHGELAMVRNYKAEQAAGQGSGEGSTAGNEGSGTEQLSGGEGDDGLESQPEAERPSKSAEEIVDHLKERYGGDVEGDPWARGEAESFDDHINRLRSVIHHSPDSTTRNQAVSAAEASLPQDPAKRLAAEQGMSQDAWLTADDAPEEAQAVYREWLEKPSDKRPPLPDTFAMVYFAGPDGQLYMRDGAEGDQESLSNIRRVEALTQDVARRNGGGDPDYQDQFRTAAQAQMEHRPHLKGADGKAANTAVSLPTALGRRSRLENFHRQHRVPTSADASQALVEGASRWVGKVVDRIGQTKGRAEGKAAKVGEMSPEVAAFIKAKGIETSGNAIHVSDKAIQHMLRDPKVMAGKALPEEAVRNLPKNLHNPKAVLWDKGTEATSPTALYVFDVQGEARRGKLVVRVNFRLKANGEKSTRNAVVSGGLVENSVLADENQYLPISGRLQ